MKCCGLQRCFSSGICWLSSCSVANRYPTNTRSSTSQHSLDDSPQLLSPLDLNRRLTATASADELLHTFRQVVGHRSFTMVNLSTAVFRMGKLLKNADRRPSRTAIAFIDEVVARLQSKKKLHFVSTRCISNILAGYGHIKVQSGPLVDAMANLVSEFSDDAWTPEVWLWL